MKKKVFSLMMGLILAFAGLANAQTEVVIGNGTSSGYYGPYYSYFYYSFTEMVWTADEIINAGGSAGQILDIAFRRAGGTAQTNTYTVYMKNVSRSSFASSTDYETVTAADIVFNGTHSSGSASGWETVTLDTPFEWDGSSNLMIGVWEQTSGYTIENFYYNASAGSNRMFQAYSDSYPVDPYNLGSYSGSKTTRTYQFDLKMHINPSGAPTTCPLVVTPDPIDFGYRPNNCWMRPMVVNVANEGAAATNIYGVDVNNNYFVPALGEDYEIPFALGRNESFDINFGWTEAPEGLVEGKLVVDYQGNRTAVLYDLTAYAYEPVEPDVWEMARVINAAYPFEYRDTPTNVTLYDNYLLPGDAQDGPDAVYKVTFNQDVMLNGTVTVVGGDEMAENGKMAVYTQAGIDAVGGPDLTNFYVGPTIGGGQGSGSYDVVFGDETTSNATGYYPCYYLYNYSLSESLYHAADLQTAGMSAGVINSIGYNSTSTYGYTVNGCKIWMANATDATLGTTSHTTAGMTCVYEGSFTQVQGWNEFELNGSFAWDGTSNLLVVFQMNNGSWDSAIQWKYTETSYVAGFVDFNDGTPYNPTTNTYTAYYNHNMLPVTHFVGGGRNRSDVLTYNFDDGTLQGWTTIDADGDGINWFATSSYYSNSGSYAAVSQSYRQTLTPNNYLVSPQLTLGEGASISFYEASYYGYTEPIALMISTTGTNASDFTQLQRWDCYNYPDFEQKTYDLSAYAGQQVYLAFRHFDSYDNYNINIDDITINLGSTQPGPTPETEYIIDGMTMIPGTYYIAASSTADAWDVVLNATELPCPEIASNPSPVDDADDLEPAAVNLTWTLGQYTTEYRLVFGSTYYCEDILVEWTTDLAQTYTVRNLYNNTNYFWRIDERNGNCETYGEVWGFTTHLNVPQNLRVADATIFEGQGAVLSWNAIQDRTYRYYNIYQDGDLIASTPANVVTTTYTVNGLTYNMGGYSFYVTAVYDEGESAPSNAVEVKVSGNGSVAGHVYEQDGETGIANATVTFTGTDEFGDNQTFNFITDATGAYGGAIMAGEYDGQAACEGYQTITEPTCGNPVAIDFNNTTRPVDFVLDENFTPVCQVIAQYYPDSLDPASPYVKVYWGCGLPGSAIIEDFETGDFSQFDYNFPGSYPWEIVTTHPYEGTYCMKSGGTNIASASSSVEVTVDIPRDGLFSFYSYISCESSFDNGNYYMDGAQMGSVTGLGNNWVKKEFAVTEGTHTFKWTYTKDSSVNSGEDAWFVDYIDFIHDAEPAQPGWHTYTEGEFDNALGSNLTTTPTWGYLYPNGGGFGGMRLTKVALFSDNQYSAVGGNYTLNVILGGATPDNGTVASTMTVDVPSNQNAWVEWDLATPVTISGNENVWVLWTANTTVSSWPAGMAPGSDANGSWWNGGNGWEQMLSSYGDVWTMKNYFAGRDGREMAHSFSSNKNANHVVAPTPHFTTVMPVKGEEVVAYNVCNPSAIHAVNVPSQNGRAFSHYRVYRTNCYQESPYTEENTVVLACELLDTLYIDVSWPDAAPGVYKWGVGVVYAGNRESEITWSEPVVVPEQGEAEEATRDIVEIGDGTGTTYYGPFNSLWGYSVVEQIYTAAEIGTAGTINSISFYMDPANTSNSAQTNSVEVFMKNVSRSAFASDGTDYEVLTAADMVYSGTVTFNLGWTTITLDTPFQYNGTDNLMIGMHEFTSGYSTRYFCYTPTTDYTLFSAHSDSSNPDPYNLGSFSGTKYAQQYRNNIQIDITPGGSGDPIQEPRESPIVWSNCLDKDMYLENVTVNVLLNSADSPEGVNVILTNLNEAEQEMYPVDPVILDETGFYAWESFRRGDYAVSVTFTGYYPIHDTVSIWSDTDLRYVMTEILAPISSDIYVSRTGWAMWDGDIPGPVPPHGGSTFSYNFDGTGLEDWTMIDANNDGNNWMHCSAYTFEDMTNQGHNGSYGFAVSESYLNGGGGAITPDNYLVSPQVNFANGSTFSFWVTDGNDAYGAEHFGVAVSTSGNTNAADFTTIAEWTLLSKGEKTGERQLIDGIWYQYTVDLSAYAGQTGYIAVRHFNCYDQWVICADDFVLTSGAKDGDRHFQYYKVMCTSIDGVPIYNHNTVIPMCQLDTNDPYQAPLVEGDTYLVKVAVMYSTGLSEWSEPVAWVYEPCEHWGPVDFVELVDDNEGNHIHWEFENGYNPYDPGHDTIPPTPQGGYIQYCTETYDGAVGTGGGQVWWANMYPAASLTAYSGTNITKVGQWVSGPDEYGNIYDGTYNVEVYVGGSASAPGTLMASGSQYITGDNAWHDIVLNTPVAIDGTQNIWVVFNANGIGYPMCGCVYVGDPNSDLLSLDGSSWEHAASGYALNYTWMIRTYAENGRGGIEAIESGMTGSTYAFNITDIANYDERVYFLHNLMNDGRFNVINGEAAGMFVISATDDSMNLEEAVNDFIFNNANEFAMMDKVQAAQVASAYKSTLPFSFVNSLMMDYYAASRENNLCELADPFCTDNGMYEFPAGVNAGSGETGPDYDCLYTTPNPAWYYMKIADPGDMDIYMYSTPSVDIDFCCWGPFDNPTAPCPNGLTADKVVSCSYSANPTEDCIIPASAQTGEYYILVITNYSNQQCNINFSKVSGSGTTDCGIMPDVDIIGFLITIDGEYLDIVGPEVRDYTHEGEYGDHVYCVRPIYPGEQNLPDHNYGWSMGCPVCTNMDCAAPSHLEGTYEWRDGQFGALISWVTDTRDIVSFNIYRSNDGIAYEKIGSIDASHTEYFDVVEIGTYYYQVTGVSECGESVPALTENGTNFVIVTVTGINENNGVTMYPNPTNGNVKIVANAMNHITVVNGLGQVVYDKDIDSDEMTINMAQFNAGIYTVRIATESGVSVQRLTVVR